MCLLCKVISGSVVACTFSDFLSHSSTRSVFGDREVCLLFTFVESTRWVGRQVPFANRNLPLNWIITILSKLSLYRKKIITLCDFVIESLIYEKKFQTDKTRLSYFEQSGKTTFKTHILKK